MLKRHSDGEELGELVSTARNTYANPGNVPQFDFHQSDKSNVSLPLISFLSSNDLMESVVPHEFGFHQLSLCTNLRVSIELEYLQPID
jgi:hypothetical protein